jgi:hypothetical protein
MLTLTASETPIIRRGNLEPNKRHLSSMLFRFFRADKAISCQDYEVTVAMARDTKINPARSLYLSV